MTNNQIFLDMHKRADNVSVALTHIKAGNVDESTYRAILDGIGFCEYIEYCLCLDWEAAFLRLIRYLGLYDALEQNRVHAEFLRCLHKGVVVNDKRLSDLHAYFHSFSYVLGSYLVV